MMPVTVLIRFPNGQYQATPWDAATNSQASEWPPSPWRIVRALLSVWHIRHPELSETMIAGLVRKLGEPPTYWLPPARAGQTQHYMPKETHRSGDIGAAPQLTIAAFLSVSPEEEVAITWPDAELTPDEVEVLTTLVGSLPYLGRAESVVAARVIARPVGTPTYGSLWTPNKAGWRRVMCPSPSMTLGDLETSPTQMRRAGRLVPVGSRWVNYSETPLGEGHPALPHVAKGVRAMRWRLVSKAPFLEEYGILATERLRQGALSTLGPREEAEETDGRAPISERDRYLLSGHSENIRRTRHEHAHWFWQADSNRRLTDLYLWIPDEEGISQAAAAGVARSRGTKMLTEVGISREQSDSARSGSGWAPQGFVPADLLLVDHGGSTVLGDSVMAPGRRWRSVTPHLLNRRGKTHQPLASLAREDVAAELRYRFGESAPHVIDCRVVSAAWTPGRPWYRTYRWSEDMSKRRRPVFLEFELDQVISGPIMLGALSHFGFGRYESLDE